MSGRALLPLCLSLAASIAAAETMPAVAAPSPPSPAVWAESAAAVEDAIRAWDGTAMTNAAHRLAALQPDSDEAAFQRAYWRGTALFHAVLCARETTGEPDAAARLRGEAMEALNEAADLRPDHAEPHAMLSVLLGFAIADQPVSAIWRGPALMRHKKAALAGDPPSPRSLYLLGVGLLERAEDEEDLRAARDQLLRAVEGFETEASDAGRAPPAPTWGYAHALMFTGEAYEKLAERERAAAYFQRALEQNPNLERAAEGYRRCSSQMDNPS